MNNKGIVTSGQIFILLFISRIITIILYSSTIFNTTKSLWDFLFPTIVSTVVVLLLSFPVLYLYKNNPSMSINEYSLTIFGKFGNVVTIFYILYFFFNIIYLISNYYIFLDYIAPDGISIWLILCFLIVACIYASFKGIEAICRLSSIIFIVFLVSFIFLVSFLMPQLDINNYIPLNFMTISTNKDIYNIIFLIISQTNEIAILAVLYPIIKGDVIRGSVLWTTSTFIFFIFSILMLFGSLGEYLNSQIFPIYQTINGSGSLQRLNPMFLAMVISGVFCQISTLIYTISQCITNISSNKYGKKFTIIIGILSIIVCFIISQYNTLQQILFNTNTGIILMLIFTFIIPIVILLFMFIKNKNNGKRKLLKTLSLICIVTITITTFSGCNTVQLNQRIIIQGIGIDKNSNGYELTMIVLDTDNIEDENKTKIIYSTGNSVIQAISNLQIRSGKDILLSQCLFIMLNENAIKTDIKNTLKYFENNNDILKNTSLVVCDNMSKNFINTSVDEFQYKTADINALFENDLNNIKCSLLDYTVFLNNHYNGIMIPYIKLDTKTQSIQNKGSITINNNYETNYLSYDEIKAISLINNELKIYKSSILVENNIIDYELKDITSTLFTSMKDDVLNLDIIIQGSLDNMSESKINNISNDIEKKIIEGLSKSVKYNGCDIISIYKIIKPQCITKYQNVNHWNSLLENSNIKVQVIIK